ncbi:MAG: phosphatase PAP2 family protein [Acidimicrobiales bacterium]|nr:phosphatase PAP2 family protein [Acidimicrobiales bacterium]
MTAPVRTFAHPLRIAAVAVVALVLSYVVAVQDPVPDWELRLTRWVNSAPDWVATATYPVMQLGTVWAPIVVAVAIVVLRRDWLLGAATIVTGFVAWFGAKAVKKVVERDRPLTFLPEIIVREGRGTGLGYVSGHSAVAAATAVLAIAALPRRARPVAVVLAGVVGVARIVHGVHLPADVVGGWAVGVLLGLGAVALVDRFPGRGQRIAPPVVAGDEEA